MKKMLIVEDEQAIRMALEDDFKLEGYHVVGTHSGRLGLELALEGTFDIILLDIMLPEMDGIEVCRTLRRNRVDTPIIMLTAKSQEIDRIVGLEIGADDYVTKPFSPRELQARVKAVLRRFEPENSSRKQVFQFGTIEVDVDGHEVRKNGNVIKFTSLEFSILRFLLEKQSKVISRDEMLDSIWGNDVFVEPRTVDTHVANLRRKIEDNPANPKWIISVRGVGYKMVNR